MSLKPYKDKKSPYWYARGTIGGKRICESTQTTNKEKAEEYIEALEAKLFSKLVMFPLGSHLELGPEMRKYLRNVSYKASRRHQTKWGGDKPIPVSYVWALYTEQYGRCAITGVTFRLGGNRSPFAPSLDRIDCSRGYDEGNVRLVCHAANIAMNAWGADVLTELALGIAAKWQEYSKVRLLAEDKKREETNVLQLQQLSS